MKLNLNDVLTFVQVCDHGSFAAAARAAGVPTSTVSRSVARLEESLGARLLHRSRRSLSLTPAGRLFRERAVRIAEELRDAEEAVAEMYARPRGTLRVAAPADFTAMGDVVIRFLRDYPEVNLELDLSNRQVDLVSEGFDLVIQHGPPEDLSHIAQKLGEEQMHIVASPAYLERCGRPAAIADLEGRDAVVFQCRARRVGLLVPGPKGPTEIPVRPRLFVNSLEAQRAGALAGLGLALLPRHITAPDIAAGRLVEVLPDLPPLSVPLYVVYPSRRYLRPVVRAFIDRFREELVCPNATSAAAPAA